MCEFIVSVFCWKYWIWCLLIFFVDYVGRDVVFWWDWSSWYDFGWGGYGGRSVLWIVGCLRYFVWIDCVWFVNVIW